jgi:hypothetical protein
LNVAVCRRHEIVSLDPTWLFLSLIPSGIGFVLFVYGKKQQRLPHLLAGVVLTVYPYLATSVTSLLAVGAAICLALWLAVRAGW